MKFPSTDLLFVCLFYVCLFMYYCIQYRVLHYPGTCLGSRTWPPLHLDAVVAMRSESRAGPRAMATVITAVLLTI
jgi:hypothetical protein